MCRMILNVGNVNADLVIQEMMCLALDENEKHENNDGVDFRHEDGWGITYLENNKLKIFKSVKAIYDDDDINQFRDLKTSLLILHTRKASKGIVHLNNVHPFESISNNNKYIFCHNGTINKDLPFDDKYTLIGSTDSEKFFYYLISNMNGKLSGKTLGEKMSQLKDYSGANFFLSDGDNTFFSTWYSKNPDYYTMKILREKDNILVSSEVLPCYKNKHWEKLTNKDIYNIKTSDMSIEIS